MRGSERGNGEQNVDDDDDDDEVPTGDDDGMR